VLTDWGEDTLLVPTLIVIKSTELKFTLPEESKSQQKFQYTNSQIITYNITNLTKKFTYMYTQWKEKHTD
jgi:hypothetical protein